MRILLRLIKTLLILALVLASFFFFLLSTTPGLLLGSKLAKIVLPGHLVVKKPQGSLSHHFSFAELHYQNENIELSLRDFNFRWQWKALFDHQLLVDELQAKTLDLRIKEPTKPTSFPPKLPLDIIINHSQIEQINFTKNGSQTRLNNLQLQARLNNKSWQLDKLDFTLANLHFALQAEGQPVLPYALTAKLDFNPLGQKSAGFVKINGDFSHYHWQAEINQPASLSAKGSLKYGSELTAQANWHDFVWPLKKDQSLASPEGSLHVNGTIPNLTMELVSTISAPLAAELEFKAQTSKQGLNSHGTIQLAQGQIDLQLVYDALAKPKIQGTLAAKPSEAATGLQTKIDARFSLNSANQGSATINLQPGRYKLAEESPLTSLEFTGGQIQARLDQQSLTLKGKLTLDPQKSLLLDLSLPQLQLDKGLQDSQKIRGQLNLKVNSLSFLEKFNPAISKLDGQLNAVLKATGTLKKPLLQSQLTLDKARLQIASLGLDLNPIQIKLDSRDKQWLGQGSIASQGQLLHLNGQGKILPRLTGSLTIEANNFPLIKTEEYLINLSPKLQLAFSSKAIDLTGIVLVPEAQIKPQNFSDSVSLSSDAVFISNKPAPAPNPLHINSDISLVMGDKVSLNVKGLQGMLDGSIHLRQLPMGPLNASGELTIREGKYQAYGQDLTIDQGELLFTGGLIDNPGINVRAIRQFNNSRQTISNASQFLSLDSSKAQTLNYSDNTTVGVQVSGRLKSPRIDLFSEPSTLSQADILSMLILGTPASQANSAGGQLLLKAVTSMNLGTGSRGAQLMDQLKQTLGLDVDIKSNTTFNQQTNQVTESNAVVVGKSLSKRIYLSYNFGLAQNDANVLTLTYLLNKFFSIQVNASANASGADLLYTHNKKERK